MKREIDEFLDSLKQFLVNICCVIDKLVGCWVMEEEWIVLVFLLEQVEVELGVVKEEKGVQVKVFVVMQKQYKCFKEIEVELKSWQIQIDRFDKFQFVCKGNIFVEFLVEEQLESVV